MKKNDTAPAPDLSLVSDERGNSLFTKDLRIYEKLKGPLRSYLLFEKTLPLTIQTFPA